LKGLEGCKLIYIIIRKFQSITHAFMQNWK